MNNVGDSFAIWMMISSSGDKTHELRLWASMLVSAGFFNPGEFRRIDFFREGAHWMVVENHAATECAISDKGA